MDYAGNWKATVTYALGQVVSYQNQSFYSLKSANKNANPIKSPLDWRLIGTNGNTVHSGTGAPVASVGKTGDFYIDRQNKALYGPKSSSGWPGTSTSLVGPMGPQGVTGATGATGPQGASGPAGPKGDTGAQGPTGAPGPSGISVGAYKPPVKWTAVSPVWTVPNDLPSQKFLATITGTLNWTAIGNAQNPDEADCTVIGLTGFGTSGNQWVNLKVTVSWNYNRLVSVPTSYPTAASAPVSFTGFVDAAVTSTVTLQCLMTVDGVNKVPDTSRVMISLINVDTVKLMP